MKNLLRMSLFIIARAGLCLAVVAWIAGQWWSIESVGDFTAASAFFFTGQAGIIVGVTSDDDADWRLDVSEKQSPVMWVFAYNAPENSELAKQITFAEPFSGLALISDSRTIGAAIRHYLVVTFFALFYGVLKWVYRKRGKAVVDE